MIRILIAALALGACADASIRWDDAELVVVAGDTLSPGTLDAPDEPPPPRWHKLPATEGICPGSLRVAVDTASRDYYAVWWKARPDSTADLLLAHSKDLTTWSDALRADTLDAGRSGCRRPPPSIAVDRGNVHVAYAMTAREGPGVFTLHSMDRGGMAHAPVVVVYGERYGTTSIAASGDVVAVAYEDPNTHPRRIGLALSHTMAHLFQSRTLISPPTGTDASAPTVTFGTEDRIAVTWRQGTQRFVRIGRVRSGDAR